MKNARLDESQVGVKIAGRNINNLRYADDTTLMVESESEVAQSCPILCHPMNRSLLGSSVHGIFQARVLEWVAISFSRGSSQRRSSALQADALPSEPPGKTKAVIQASLSGKGGLRGETVNGIYCIRVRVFCVPN